MDLIGVRAGCTFTGFAGNGFTGNRATVRAEQWDRWVVFARFVLCAFLCFTLNVFVCFWTLILEPHFLRARSYAEISSQMHTLRDAPSKNLPNLFGHGPYSDCTTPPPPRIEPGSLGHFISE